MGICHNNKRETSKTNSTVFLSPEGTRVAEVTSNKNQASLRYQDALFYVNIMSKAICDGS